MKLNIFTDSIDDLKADVVVIFNEKGKVALRGLESDINKLVDGKVAEIIESGEFSSGQDDFLYFFGFGRIKQIERVGLVGFDLEGEKTLNPLRSAAAMVVKSLRKAGLKKVALVVPNVRGYQMSESARAIVEGMLMGLYRFEKYLEKESDKKLAEIVLVGNIKDKRTFEKAILLGEMEAGGILLARDVGNEPSNVLTPDTFANIAQKMMNKVKVGCKVLDHNDLKKEGLGLLYGVGKGSENQPRLVVMNYNAGRKYPTIGIVGKGITFDSGGTSLKDSDETLFDMKRDMSGAGAVLGLMYVLGQIKPKINVIGLLPLAENMLSGNSYKPGDILMSYCGKTVEIFNTDAEGRLVMADALSYVQENYKLDYLIDVATLTGAVMRTAGPSMIGLFGNDNRLLERVRKAGILSGEEMFDFPIYEGYRVRVKSHFADLKNISYKGPAAITSAMFLEEFVEKGMKWAHLDIAAMGTQNGEGTFKTRGATGVGVLTLINLVMGLGK
jgi:leucyl aminopeptidase